MSAARNELVQDRRDRNFGVRVSLNCSAEPLPAGDFRAGVHATLSKGRVLFTSKSTLMNMPNRVRSPTPLLSKSFRLLPLLSFSISLLVDSLLPQRLYPSPLALSPRLVSP